LHDWDETITALERLDRDRLRAGVRLAALIPVRRYFTVRSGRPGLGRTLAGVGWVALVCAVYGILGFWFFDRRQFGGR
jgi:hypothetical protein